MPTASTERIFAALMTAAQSLKNQEERKHLIIERGDKILNCFDKLMLEGSENET
jgi:hypothetical protein